jgi:hypothetical protein
MLRLALAYRQKNEIGAECIDMNQWVGRTWRTLSSLRQEAFLAPGRGVIGGVVGTEIPCGADAAFTGSAA